VLNATVILKVKQRLNKLDSQDYDNIEPWVIIEAFNKGVVDWCRRNLHGSNIKQTGDEQSKRRIDDLQILLTDTTIGLDKEDGYFVSTDILPGNYFEWKRISGKATQECCKDPRTMVITLAEEANVDEVNRDFNKKPSFEWGETYCTLNDNRVRIHTNNDFEIPEAILTYYRQPIRIQVNGVSNPYTQVISTIDVDSEFKDDMVELFIDEAAKIIAGDIESFNQQQTASNQVESNN
jgi:hypothetical protein